MAFVSILASIVPSSPAPDAGLAPESPLIIPPRCPAFRTEVLAALRRFRSRWPGAKVFLFYTAELGDPLDVLPGIEAGLREHAAIIAGAGGSQSTRPLVIELDGRRAAPFIFESDASFDDPLLEASIALVHQHVGTPTSEDAGDLLRDRALSVCGWIVSTDSAKEIARRIGRASSAINAISSKRCLLRWHDPRVLSVVWPSFSEEQQVALLGEQSAWVAVDATAALVEFVSDHSDKSFADATADRLDDPMNRPQLRMSTEQWKRALRAGAVNHLACRWRHQSDAPLPRDAIDTLHDCVEQAEALGLDGTDLQVFALTAARLRRGFNADPVVRQAADHAREAPGTLADRFAELPVEVWTKYQAAN